ncbi:RNA polymerase sigma factor [Hymenobacter psoromatis]|uniref:RNA polymerase sigma factor n=1 Tax=Hymenobacter psoromatis TaxID=1484116 RepID=UPI001CBEA9F5|nr:sigma-70 family RNA polymerase sigma factor [Hymenobacter psoromatis]
MAKPDDKTLDEHLTRLRQADPAVFLEQLFKAFYAPLGSLVYRVVPDRAAVEDILQDVFLRVWQGLATLPAIGSHRAYLTRMALNAALRYQQRARRQVAWDEAPPAAAPVAPDALADLHAAETSAAVAAALARLPPQCRIVFELSRYEELSYQQIAEALEIAPKTVENQLGKALRILRRELAGVLKNLYGLLVYVLVSHPSAAGVCALPPPVPARWPAYFAGPRGGSAPGAYLPLEAAARPAPTLP